MYAQDPGNYAMERYVNDRMEYSVKDLWNLKVADKVYAGRTRQTKDHINRMARKNMKQDKLQEKR